MARLDRDFQERNDYYQDRGNGRDERENDRRNRSQGGGTDRSTARDFNAYTSPSERRPSREQDGGRRDYYGAQQDYGRQTPNAIDEYDDRRQMGQQYAGDERGGDWRPQRDWHRDNDWSRDTRGGEGASYGRAGYTSDQWRDRGDGQRAEMQWDRTGMGEGRMQGWSGAPQESGRMGDWDRPSAGGHRGKGPKNYTRSDEQLREDVCRRLTDHDGIDAGDIDVKVEGGEVTLVGTVADRQMKRMAEDVAEDCSGVKHVQNNLRVNRGGEAGDSSTSGGMKASSNKKEGAGESSRTTGESSKGNPDGAKRNQA
ncbi:MAG: BON domain-containing protein [Myxococcota bacterium]